MSNCWCKCEAGVGQCGPKVPKLKALFRSYKDGDDAPEKRNDRQAELQALWQECGEDKLMRQEDLKVAVADAVDRVYDKSREEALRRRAALMANVLASEERIRDILGIEAEIAPKELPLQTRLDANLSRLHELENLRGDGFGWMGGLVILMQLRRRMSALRTTLNVPAGPDGSKFEEMLHTTIKALEHPDKDSSEGGSSKTAPQMIKKPIFQRLESFYKNLCGLDDSSPEQPTPSSSPPPKEKGVPGGLPPRAPKEPVSPEKGAPGSKQEYPQIRVAAGASPDQAADRKESYPTIIAAPTDIQEELTLESLGAKIIKKLDEINAKHATTHGSPLQSNDNKRPLPHNPQTLPQPKIPRCISVGAAPFLWPTDLNAVAETQRLLQSGSCEEEPSVSGGSFLSSFFSEGTKSVFPKPQNGVSENGTEQGGIRPLNLFGGFFASGKAPPERTASSPDPPRTPPLELARTPSLKTPLVLHQSSSEGVLSTPRPPPPPPPKRALMPGGAPPPPPPPPPPGMLGVRKQSKLKRSSKMGALYRGLKRRVEGTGEGLLLAQEEGDAKDASAQKSAQGGSATGMAEMLGEITKRSAYFQQIAADVKQHASAIQEAKSAIESFRTSDMAQLLAFRLRIEEVLETLTDESQVLARFEGFPSRKLETIRMAASLHSRLASMKRDLEGWKLEATAFESLEKAIRYFDKMKKEVEACERTQDEDSRRFAASNINFDFTTITRVKEAAVELSGRLLEVTLQESKQLRGSVDVSKGLCAADLTKARQQVHTIWGAFQFAFRVYNFAGGQDEKGEQLAEALAAEMEEYPPGVWG